MCPSLGAPEGDRREADELVLFLGDMAPEEARAPPPSLKRGQDVGVWGVWGVVFSPPSKSVTPVTRVGMKQTPNTPQTPNQNPAL
jgi:hypothetical protein